MDQGDANLFDPLMGAKEAGGDKSNGVMVEDLLGGFSEMVAPDLKAADSTNPTNGSATSFFLLDLDTGGGGGDTSAPDFMLGKSDAMMRPTSAVESISDNSEVLSISETNLPMGDNGSDDALMSGFFNDVLQADGLPDGGTLANAATVQGAMDSSATTSSETTLVGEEDMMTAATATAVGNGVMMMGASEENLDSIMDLEVPTAEPTRDLFDTTEVEAMPGGEGSGRLVKVSTLENLVTEEEGEGGVIGETVNGEVVKHPPQLGELGGTELSDDEHPLASELRPVFEMFDPEGKGWIGVDQLEELCQSQGQVTSFSSFPQKYFQPFNSYD